ncbi:hypothetical protein AB0H36_30745 [Kribbella sp. NPDC050820]|uniref:hypothetical protein n=1 Tax=Kribbella sp. NPDC050820 TaxID=3155408 RepID=UPI003406D942
MAVERCFRRWRMSLEAHAIKEALLNDALIRAGIDRHTWRPHLGFAANKRAVEAVYNYYGQLFLAYPHLKWAGMASLIGPSFYAGFQDLGFVPDVARKAAVAVYERSLRRFVKRTVADLGFYETTFLRMQKKIFEDQAPMHEAYITHGVAKIEELYHSRIIDLATLEAWRDIDRGQKVNDTALIDRGNRALLFREQLDIIDRFYLQMLRHDRPEGLAFTYLLTLAGAPSIPGTHSFPERFPLAVVARLPQATISVRTPLANGNIAVFANRWRLIEDDTLPQFLGYVAGHADEARTLVGTPVSERAERYQLHRRAGYLVVTALTRWDVSVAAAGAVPLESPPRKPLLAAMTDDLSIDLTSPPTRASAGFDEGADSRVWMNPNRRPFDVRVLLPGGRVYRTSAAEAVMLSSTATHEPDRLMVQPPAADLDADATQRLIAQYAAEWGFPADAATGWRTGVERRIGSDRNYSTHVFTPDNVGFVHLEFQVSHHVSEGTFVVSTLFSWTSTAPGTN